VNKDTEDKVSRVGTQNNVKVSEIKVNEVKVNGASSQDKVNGEKS
jgi:hypothetical protein